MLRLSSRLEPLDLPFSSVGRPMRILSSIIQVSARAMPNIRKDGTLSDAVTAHAISNEPPRFVFQPSREVLEEALGCRGIPPLLDKDIQHDLMLIHRAPQIVSLASDTDEHLVEVPFVARHRPSPAQLAGKLASKFLAPVPHALMRHHRAAFGQNQLDIPQAEAEQVILPHGVANDLGWEPVPRIGSGRGKMSCR
jgi:hypothetical protein